MKVYIVFDADGFIIGVYDSMDKAIAKSTEIPDGIDPVEEWEVK